MDTILIYDSEPLLLEALRKSLERDYHVCCCSSREDFLTLAAELEPLVLVVDLTFAGEDTVAALQSLFMSGYRTHIVASGNYCSRYLTDRLEQLNAHSYIFRPCTANAVLRGIMDAALADSLADTDRRKCINDLLLSLGLRMDLQGYRYVFDAIVYTMEHPNCVLTSQLYPDIGKPYHTSSAQAEKAIRDCLYDAWKRRDPRIWKRYFPVGIQKNKFVTNGVFIKRMAYAVEDYLGFVKSKTGTD